MLANLTMALILSKLFGNQTKKWNKSIDIINTLLNFKLLVRHNQAKSDKNLINYIQAKLAITFNFTPANAIFRFLIFIILDNYKLNVAKILEFTFYFTYILVKKKRVVEKQEFE